MESVDCQRSSSLSVEGRAEGDPVALFILAAMSESRTLRVVEETGEGG